MDDGFGMNGWSGLRSQGYDIGPDEDRFAHGTPVDLITNIDNPQHYERVFTSHPRNGIFEEPFDMASGVPEVEYGGTAPATDPRFHSEVNRLKTFEESWLEDYHVSPRDLARDGFIHIGPGDRVKCVFCLKTLRNWEPQDSVEREHRKHYPDCPFVKGKCDHLNVPMNPAESMKSFGLKMRTAEQLQSSSRHQMQDFSDRLNSYKTWPKRAVIRPDALAEAGMFYCGEGDKVQCFSCDRIFSHWEPGDDPWVEHAKWSPACPHIHAVKGSEFVHHVQDHFNEKKNVSGHIGQENHSTAVHMSEEAQLVNGPFEQPQPLSQPVQVSSAQIAEDLKSAPVQAVLQTYDVPLESMIKRIRELRITKGPTYKVTSKDLEDLVD